MEDLSLSDLLNLALSGMIHYESHFDGEKRYEFDFRIPSREIYISGEVSTPYKSIAHQFNNLTYSDIYNIIEIVELSNPNNVVKSFSTIVYY